MENSIPFIPLRRYIVTEEMLNANGTLFGGRAMGWMDLLGYDYAVAITRQTMYTLSADKIKFLKPVFLGESVEVVAEVLDKGPVKLILAMKVIADPDGPNRREALSGLFTFVHLDENHRPKRITYPTDVCMA